MPEFLELLPPTEALQILLNHLPKTSLKSEWVLSAESLCRVTFSATLSPENLPAFPRSTVDGYAVRASDTFGASDSLPMYLALVGEAPMGRAPDFVIRQGQAGLIHTAGMLPEGCDAAVMLEKVQAARP